MGLYDALGGTVISPFIRTLLSHRSYYDTVNSRYTRVSSIASAGIPLLDRILLF